MLFEQVKRGKDGSNLWVEDKMRSPLLVVQLASYFSIYRSFLRPPASNT
jgi:hypothetical protein